MSRLLCFVTSAVCRRYNLWLWKPNLCRIIGRIDRDPSRAPPLYSNCELLSVCITGRYPCCLCPSANGISLSFDFFPDRSIWSFDHYGYRFHPCRQRADLCRTTKKRQRISQVATPSHSLWAAMLGFEPFDSWTHQFDRQRVWDDKLGIFLSFCYSNNYRWISQDRAREALSSRNTAIIIPG